MSADCRAVTRNLRLGDFERVARVAVSSAPGLRNEDDPDEVASREVRVSDAAARLADALHLHLD